MNIQIFGTKKCNDTKKAERYFKRDKVSVCGYERKGDEQRRIHLCSREEWWI